MLKRGSLVLGIPFVLMSMMTGLAQQPAGPPQPSPEHKKLGMFVGTWRDEAEMKPGPLGPGGKLSLTEMCDWFAGGFSVVCRTETTGFVGNLKTLTILTYSSEEKAYKLYEFNNVGWSNTAKGTVVDDTWTFEGESKMGNKLIRSRSLVRMLSPDSAAMRSEISIDGAPMVLFMELKGRKLQAQTDFNACGHASEGWAFECFEKWKDPR